MTSFEKVCVSFLRFCVTQWLRLTYRFHALDVDCIPEQGPVLLVGNHYTFLDSLIIYCASKRPVRFIADSAFLPKKNRLAKFVIRATGVISFSPGNARSGVKMIQEARNALANGEVVCIFAEGALTRDGQVRAFKPGFLSILKKTPEIPIVPFNIDGFFGTRWAYARKKTYKYYPTYRPRIAFGQPFDLKKARDLGQSDEQISQRLLHIVQELSVDSCDYKKHPENVWLRSPSREAIRGMRRYGRGRNLLADSTGRELDSFKALLAILVLRRVCHRLLKDEKYVGVILPTSVAGVLVNVAISMDHRIPVNLNYTFTNEVLNHCAKKVGLKKVFTSSQLLKKLPNLKIDAELLVMEELVKSEVRTSDKIVAFIESLLPTCLLERVLGLTKQKLTDVNTIVYTSGSTGLPKGTVLTNLNIVANCQSFIQSAMPERDDALYGTLPFFHSFGYTVTVWFPLIQSFRCAYHYNPLDYKMVGETAKKLKPTLFISTPTFMRTYVRKCTKEDFATIDFPVPGAEKVPPDLYDAWKEKFGYELDEGYGTTELAPVLCHNIPTHRAPDKITPYHEEGSVGRADPGFVAKIVDVDSGEELPPNTPGMLVVKGNSVTPGYLDEPELTAKIFRNGWYITGDIARIDEYNFIFITGRESRISKIGGEMAPHVLIEERLTEAARSLVAEQNGGNLNEDDENPIQIVITAVPDEKKGEKLVALYVDLPVSPEDICQKARDLDLLPHLWIPAPANFREIDQLPVLGTGKLDIKGIKRKAMELYGVDREI